MVFTEVGGMAPGQTRSTLSTDNYWDYKLVPVGATFNWYLLVLIVISTDSNYSACVVPDLIIRGMLHQSQEVQEVNNVFKVASSRPQAFSPPFHAAMQQTFF